LNRIVATVSRRQLGIVLVLVGVVAALIAALADPLGIGEEGGFGWKQGVLLVIGIILIIGGITALRSPISRTGAQPSGNEPPPAR
jgi:hypothetical protein